MFQRILASAVVLLVAVGFVAAETYRGTIIDITKNEVTIKAVKKVGDKGEEKKIELYKDAKFVKLEIGGKKKDASFGDIKKAIDATKKKEMKGVFGFVTTVKKDDKEVAVEIAFTMGMPKKDKDSPKKDKDTPKKDD